VLQFKEAPNMRVVFVSLDKSGARTPLTFRGFLIEPDGTIVGSNGFLLTILQEAIEPPGERLHVVLDKLPPKAALVTVLDIENNLLYHNKGVEKASIAKGPDATYPDYQKILDSQQPQHMEGEDASVSWLNVQQAYPAMAVLREFRRPWRYVGNGLARFELPHKNLHVFTARENWHKDNNRLLREEHWCVLLKELEKAA
jgi:hypothetical protein